MPSERIRRIAELKTSVGRAIAAARRSRGLRQSEVAAQLGVEQETISRFERGVTLHPLDRIMDLAVLFDVPIGVFFSEAPGPKPTNEEQVTQLLGLLSEEERRLVLTQVKALCEAMLHRRAAAGE